MSRRPLTRPDGLNAARIADYFFRPSPGVRWFCLSLAALMIFNLFSLGAQPIAAGLIDEPWDKLARFVAFGSMTVLLSIATAGGMPLTVVGVLAAVGALDEWHQT